MAPFIVFEGVEGSGKSTQVRLLGEWLDAHGIAHVLGREPGGTVVGEEIRRALLHGGDVPARSELLLMLAARAAFVEQVVRPALARGEVVVADRYELSSLAYQGGGRRLGFDAVRAVNAFATGGLRPDLTILLDVPLEEGTARRAQAGADADRIESAGDAFHREVAGAYRLLSETEAGVVAVPGVSDPAVVHAAVMRLLAVRFPETFGVAAG
ncbi:MAG TPA: dTMP kinase [Longimicrobiales bacterium]|nr:dTMP kinase [Longimicrobiales bacterium]